MLGCFRKLPPWGFHCTLRLNAEVPSSAAAPGWGARPWGDAWGGCGSRDPPSTHHTSVTMQRRPLQAVPGEKPLHPQLGSAPLGTALWGLPPSMPHRGEGQRVEGTESGFGEQLPLALPCCHVLGTGGLILGRGGKQTYRG